MILSVFLVLYGIVTVALIIGVAKQNRLQQTERKLKLSVLVPAKDESETIDACLDALLNQDYPADNFEIIVINDQSMDDTAEKVSKRKNQRLKLIDVNPEIRPTLVGKAKAISIGIDYSNFDIIVMTDADCRPNPEWLKTIAANFSDEIAVVSGITILDTQVKNKLFAIMQSIDWVFLLGAGSAAVGLGMPISCIGSNLAFRKEVFQQIGGYEQLKFSVTEDLQLYKTIAKKTKSRFRFPMQKEMLNISLPMTGFSDYYRQRKRWALGSFDINFFGGVLLTIAIGAHLFALLPAFSLFSNGIDLQPLFTVFVADFLMISFFLTRIGYSRFIIYLPLYFIFYLVNVILLSYVLLFDRTVEWKGRRYNKNGLL